nr:hypothetical protein [Tanacetum cinerariifolium]
MARERERKAKTTLLMALPKDHLAKYHKIANEKEITNNVSTAYSVSSPSISKSQKEGSASYTDEVIHSFFANQSSAPQLDYDDLEQINDDDLKEMDLKWQVAMISMRIKKFHKRTDCRAKWNQDSRRRDGGYNANKARDNCRRPASQDDLKALVTIDGEAIDWSGHVEEDTQNFDMMAYSSSNSSFDNELWSLNNSLDLYPKFPNKVYKVVKALYGLHQASRDWYATLSTFLERSGYIRGAINKTLFIKQEKKDIMLVQVYVDDIIFGSTKKSWCDEFKESMQNSVKTASTPIETQKPLVKDKASGDVDVHLYRFQVTPKNSHLQAVKRIFRYLKGQLKLGLWYPKVSSFKLEAYSDSDYAGANLDRKSTTGDFAFLKGKLLEVTTVQESKEFASPKQTNLVLKPPPGMNLAALWHQQSSVLQQTRSLTSPNMIQKLEDRVDQLEEENKALKEKSFKTTQVDTTAPIENIEKSFKQRRMIADMDENVEEAQAKAYNLDLQHAKKVLSMQDMDEEKPAKVEEVLEVVKVAKLMTEVVNTAQPTTTAAQVPKASAPRRRRGVIIQDLEEIAASIIMHLEIDMDEAFVRQLEAELNVNIKWNDVIEQVKRSEKQDNAVMSEIRPIFKKHYNSIQAFLEKVEEEVILQEEGNKRQSKSLEQELAKKQRIDEEEEELKTHLHIMDNDDDDVYTEATPLASKVLVVDYQIHHENNKPYYKIIRADGTNKLFLSFITLLKNFDREDLEALWKIVKKRFETTEPKNFLDDFLLNILRIMFKKPNVEASVWKDEKGIYGLAKVKSWKLFESCGVYIITLTTTQMFLLVEKKYPLTHFTLQQMLDNVRLEVEEESEMSLELLRLVRSQLNEGYVQE